MLMTISVSILDVVFVLMECSGFSGSNNRLPEDSRHLCYHALCLRAPDDKIINVEKHRRQLYCNFSLPLKLAADIVVISESGIMPERSKKPNASICICR